MVLVVLELTKKTGMSVEAELKALDQSKKEEDTGNSFP